ncbi:MAG: hypothetical protein N2043_01765 [Ignavibacterium sp.]|nr:hypothetical protein [Ignavibacterium sp.]
MKRLQLHVQKNNQFIKNLFKEITLVPCEDPSFAKENKKAYKISIKKDDENQVLFDEQLSYLLGIDYEEFVKVIVKNKGFRYLEANSKTSTIFFDENHALSAIEDIYTIRKQKAEELKNKKHKFTFNIKVGDVVKVKGDKRFYKVSSLPVSEESKEISVELQDIHTNKTLAVLPSEVRPLTLNERKMYKRIKFWNNLNRKINQYMIGDIVLYNNSPYFCVNVSKDSVFLYGLNRWVHVHKVKLICPVQERKDFYAYE